MNLDLCLCLALRCGQTGVALGRAGGEARHLDPNEYGRVQLPGRLGNMKCPTATGIVPDFGAASARSLLSFIFRPLVL